VKKCGKIVICCIILILIKKNIASIKILLQYDNTDLWKCEMDRRKELIQQYKELKKEGGVFQIRNTKNNKIFIDAVSDLKSLNGKRFQLQTGIHKCLSLQKEWNEYGESAFVFEVLETYSPEDESVYSQKDILIKLKQKWLNQLKPFGERGYNDEGDLK